MKFLSVNDGIISSTWKNCFVVANFIRFLENFKTKSIFNFLDDEFDKLPRWFIFTQGIPIPRRQIFFLDDLVLLNDKNFQDDKF